MTNAATKAPLDLAIFIESYQARINQTLTACLDQHASNNLAQVLCYAVLGSGKRLRPLLVYATGITLGAEISVLDKPAAAVELIHCYSLVHDDLPAMDDDDLRRGKPTCHKAFNEATAILAGDALQTLAFELLSAPQSFYSANTQLTMINTLAKASGSSGMAGGQALDLNSEGKAVTLPELETIHNHKTGALIQASIQLGALATDTYDDNTLLTLDCFAKKLGLAFQIQDDILDVEETTEALGKKAGADAAHQKATYPALLGLEQSKAFLQNTYQEAIAALETLNLDTTLLAKLARHLVERRN